MPSFLETKPIFTDVARAAELLLVGKLVDVVDEEPDLLEDGTERLITTARFIAEEIIKGESRADHFDVRLVPALSEGVRQWGADRKLFLALSADHAEQYQGERFVPAFSTILPIHDDSEIEVPETAMVAEIPGTIAKIRDIAAELEQLARFELERGLEAGETELSDDEQRDREVEEMPPQSLRNAGRGEIDDLARQSDIDAQSVEPMGTAPRP